MTRYTDSLLTVEDRIREFNPVGVRYRDAGVRRRIFREETQVNTLLYVRGGKKKCIQQVIL